MQLVVPLTSVASISSGAYVLSVTVTNVWGKSATATLGLAKQATAAAPTIGIEAPPASFTPSTGLRLAGRLFASSVCADSSAVAYSWSSTLPGLDLSASTAAGLFVRGPIPDVLAGTAYTFTLTARFEGSSEHSTASATLTAVGAPLVASISGPAGDVSAAKTITLNGAKSLDPDDPANALSPMTYSWACAAPDAQPCFTDAEYMGVQEGATWALDLAKVGEGAVVCGYFLCFSGAP